MTVLQLSIACNTAPPALSVSPIVDGYFLIRFRPANLQLFLTLGNKGDLIGFCAGRFRI